LGPPAKALERFCGEKEEQRKTPPLFVQLDCTNKGGVEVSSDVAEGVGFEPTKLSLACFQDRCTRPTMRPFLVLTM
jgi:hypothetical protein